MRLPQLLLYIYYIGMENMIRIGFEFIYQGLKIRLFSAALHQAQQLIVPRRLPGKNCCPFVAGQGFKLGGGLFKAPQPVIGMP